MTSLFDPAPALIAAVGSAADASALARLAGECRDYGVALATADAGPALVCRVITQLNDAVTGRAIELVRARRRLPGANWCWLAFGSEARGEQTFVTDQDNGIVFSATDAGEARELRLRFQTFATEVNASLDACGLPLCAGGIMAGNPDWCLSEEEWRQRFSGWIRTPDPAALLNATIFFDFRPLHGDAALAVRLRDWLLSLTAANKAFLRMLAVNALSVTPPLGLLGDVVGTEDAAGRVDLKTLGSRLFVDAARIQALAQGHVEMNTVARLRRTGGGGAEASVQAYLALMRLRLVAQQAGLNAGETPDNRMNVGALNDFDQRLLKEALRQARRLQGQLKTTYSIHG